MQLWEASTCGVASSAAVAATVGYEVRRVRDEREMNAALGLRHEVFCVEQRCLSGRRSTGATPTASTSWPSRPDGCLARAGCC